MPTNLTPSYWLANFRGTIFITHMKAPRHKKHWYFAFPLVICSQLQATAGPPALPSSDPGKPPQFEIPLLIIGSPAVVELSSSRLASLISKTDATQCTVFKLMPSSGPLSSVRVTASGLDTVTFLGPGGPRTDEITVDDLPAEGLPLSFCIKRNVDLEPGESFQGKLIAFSPGYKPTAFAVKVSRPALEPWAKAMEWFLAILVPAILAGAFGILSAWATASLSQRRDQKIAFRKAKDDNWDDLKGFFRAHIRNVLKDCEDESDFLSRLRSELQDRGYWSSIPWKERDQLEDYVKRGNGLKMRSLLAALYFEWEIDPWEFKK